MENPAIPTYLRRSLNIPKAQSGIWGEREAAEQALYWNISENEWNDWRQDVSRGTPWAERVTRHGVTLGLPSRPGNWQPPELTTGGESLTVPQTSELPAWMQPQTVPQNLQNALTDIPDWRNPYSPEQISSLLEGADVDINAVGKQMGGDISSQMARRGLSAPGGTSSYEQNATAGLANWQRAAMARARANLTQTQIQRGDLLRQENIGNQLTLNDLNRANRQEGSNVFGNLYNQLSGSSNALQGNMDLTPYANAATQRAGIYGQQAANYGNMASQGMSGVGNLLGQWNAFNEWQRSQRQPATRQNALGSSSAGGIGTEWYYDPATGTLRPR